MKKLPINSINPEYKGLSVMVDDDIYEKYKDLSWTYTKQGPSKGRYVVHWKMTNGKTRRFVLHREIAKDKGYLQGNVVFKDGNPLNCQRSNIFSNRVLTLEKHKTEFIGRVYGLWTLTKFSHYAKGKYCDTPMFHCKCECGTERLVALNNLEAGASKSCGCNIDHTGKYEDLGFKTTNVGNPKKSLYTARIQILEQCYNPKSARYPNYGMRGIKMYKKWKENTHEFLEWCLNNGWKEGLFLCRKDVTKDYVPDNIIFLDKTQKTSKHMTRRYSFRGITLGPLDWCEKLDISRQCFYQRLERYGEDHYRTYLKKGGIQWWEDNT